MARVVPYTNSAGVHFDSPVSDIDDARDVAWELSSRPDRDSHSCHRKCAAVLGLHPIQLRVTASMKTYDRATSSAGTAIREIACPPPRDSRAKFAWPVGLTESSIGIRSAPSSTLMRRGAVVSRPAPHAARTIRYVGIDSSA